MHQRIALLPATGRHQVWALDFIHDRLVDGRQVRVLGVMDHYSRECLARCVDPHGGTEYTEPLATLLQS